jgi:hypothetical protein
MEMWEQIWALPTASEITLYPATLLWEGDQPKVIRNNEEFENAFVEAPWSEKAKKIINVTPAQIVR